MDQRGRQNTTLVDNYVEPLPDFWLTLSLSLIAITTLLMAALAILTMVLALKKKRLLEAPVRTWVMNVNFYQ